MATKKMVIVLEVEGNEGSLPDKQEFADYLGAVLRPGYTEDGDCYQIEEFSVYEEQDATEMGMDGTLQDFEAGRLPF
jgi:hypothetical protein